MSEKSIGVLRRQINERLAYGPNIDDVVVYIIARDVAWARYARAVSLCSEIDACEEYTFDAEAESDIELQHAREALIGRGVDPALLG